MATPGMIPEELLSSILCLLPTQTLATVSLVSRTFRRIAEPLLYANLSLLATPRVSVAKSTTPQPTTCHLLHRSLQSRSDLATHIKTFVMEARNPSFFATLSSATVPPLRLPNLTTLILRQAQITMWPLQQLLAMTPRLQDLEFHSECDCEPLNPFRMRYFDSGLLSSALDAVSGTLVRLKITIEFVATTALEPENGGSFENRDSWGVKGSLGTSLRRFSRLESVDVPWVVLLGWSTETELKMAECLPEGLRGLILAHDLEYFSGYGWGDRDCVDRLLGFLAEGNRPVGLESLGIRFDEDDEEDEEYQAPFDQVAWKRVEERCRGVGCRFQIEGREL